MAADAPVLFLEPPVFADDIGEATLELSIPSPNVHRAVPTLPAIYRDDYDAAIAQVRSITIAELRTTGRLAGLFDAPIQWFMTPMPAPAMLGAFQEISVVYDCVDELAQRADAHPDLARRERVLLANADVVFTAGEKLANAKTHSHGNAHFIGNGVDVAHFATARHSKISVARDIAHLPGPVAGYAGVIDERIDYVLLAQLAMTHPSLQIVMVGPVQHVDAALLPQAPNIHWVGSRSYETLPQYLKAFDVYLLPFALNDTTEYTNPHEALEAMAAGVPVVSTAVADVVRNLTPVVNVALTPDEFVELVSSDALHPDADYVAEGIAIAEVSTWEPIVARMQTLVAKAITERRQAPAVRPELVIGFPPGVSSVPA